jgi:hypothetical protein
VRHGAQLSQHGLIFSSANLWRAVSRHATPRHATRRCHRTQLSPDVFKTTIETINSFFEDAERHTQALYWRNFANCLLGYVPVRLQWCALRSSLGLPSVLSLYISLSLSLPPTFTHPHVMCHLEMLTRTTVLGSHAAHSARDRYVADFCLPNPYNKHLNEMSAYVDEQNSTVYNPRGLQLVNPLDRGLRVIEITNLPGGSRPFIMEKTSL